MAIISHPTSWKTRENSRTVPKRIDNDPTLIVESPRPVRPKRYEREPGEQAIEIRKRRKKGCQSGSGS